ncbi:hypothetical protein BC831DRAFT_514668 [Entophlyctis helioformis]|nr:hypothetical protein BC831DRAFT_514668 [Entophlyctis helioformis]
MDGPTQPGMEKKDTAAAVLQIQRSAPNNAALADFELGPERLLELIDPKNPALLQELGGIEGLAKALKSDLTTGLSDPLSGQADQGHESKTKTDGHHGQFSDGFDDRRRFYGSNALPEPIQSTIFQLMWEALQDHTLLVLIVAAVVEMSIGVYKFRFAPEGKRDDLALIDGAAIIIAILVVVLVASFSDFQKQSQFRALNDFGKSLSEVKVIRNGITRSIPTSAVVVGDICLLQTGDVIPADCVLVQGYNVEADESTLTGEPHAIEKDALDPFLLSGTKVVNGVGRMIAIATGVNSLNGRSLLALEVEPEETPLQEKLGRIADFIAKFAVIAAIAMIVFLIIIYFSINRSSLKEPYEVSQDILSLFILAVTVVVVAVPEGLPLAVTLSLAHATLQMLKDNNLVRHLSACETMGNATTICSDKTGTLTMNKMTAVKGNIIQIPFDRDTNEDTFKSSLLGTTGNEGRSDHMLKLLAFIACSLNVNSTAGENADKTGKVVFTGSKTEIAILDLTTRLGFPYKLDRDRTQVLQIEPFSSERKRMSILIKAPRDEAFEKSLGLGPIELASTERNRRWMFVKGASEIILAGCTRFINAQGVIEVMSAAKRAQLEATIAEYAAGSLRTICAAIKTVLPTQSTLSPVPQNPHQKLDDGDDLILVALFGILDPVRPEVPDAVALCQKAGVVVRMVTGDNIVTAKAIATECGILSADGIVMEGPKFRALSQEQMDDILPHLQVLARSSPLDKQILVNNLKRLGETVAVTGDGTNDAPALSAADVGFSMGIAGTEVAKEASDIVLMDDNFASLVKAVVWGRTVYDSIRKFLQFQLTVNASAVVVTLISAFSTTVGPARTPYPALSAVQLLWINLIMDTLAALALATDPPSIEVLDRKPANRAESIISVDMMRQIVGQGVFQIVAILTIYYKGYDWWGASLPESERKSEAGVDVVTATVIFNTFVFCQVFNEINSRSITRELNVFKGFFRNQMFVGILMVTVFCQVIIVQFAGIVFKTNPKGLDIGGWVISVLVGALSLPFGALIRLLPDIEFLEWLIPKQAFERVTSSSTVALQMMPLEATSGSAHEQTYGQQQKISIRHAEGGGATQDEEAAAASRERERWETAIRATRIQLRVIKLFRVPDSETSRITAPSSGLSAWPTRKPHAAGGGAASCSPRQSFTSVDIRSTSPPGSRLGSGSGAHPFGHHHHHHTEIGGLRETPSLGSEAGVRTMEEPSETRSMWDRVRSVMSVSQAFHRSLRPSRVDYATLQLVDANRIRQAQSATTRRRALSHGRSTMTRPSLDRRSVDGRNGSVNM